MRLDAASAAADAAHACSKREPACGSDADPDAEQRAEPERDACSPDANPSLDA